MKTWKKLTPAPPSGYSAESCNGPQEGRRPENDKTKSTSRSTEIPRETLMPPSDVNRRELREENLAHYKNLTPSRAAYTGEMFHEDDGKDMAPLLRHDDLSVLATVSSCYDVST